MKMEIPIPAEQNGTISEVLVEAGQEIDIGGLIAYLTIE
jgi:biotin carboxyl carrier protein